MIGCSVEDASLISIYIVYTLYNLLEARNGQLHIALNSSSVPSVRPKRCQFVEALKYQNFHTAQAKFSLFPNSFVCFFTGQVDIDRIMAEKSTAGKDYRHRTHISLLITFG